MTFLRTAFEPEDWLAVLLKSSTTGRIVQRIGPVSLVASSRFLEWLRRENTERTNIYVSVNAVKPGQLTRRRRAIHAIRHVFLDVDHSGPEAIEFIGARRDLPEPSYVLSSSPKRHHVFWRVSGFSIERAEGLQRRLARELGADLAATSASQMTRLPGFMNHKYQVAPLVRIEYRCEEGRYPSCEFPRIRDRHRAAGRGHVVSVSPSLAQRRSESRALPDGDSAGDLGPAWGSPHVPGVLSSRSWLWTVRSRRARVDPPVEPGLRAAMVGAGAQDQAVERAAKRPRAHRRIAAGPPMTANQHLNQSAHAHRFLPEDGPWIRLPF